MSLMWALVVCAAICLVMALFLAALPDAKNVNITAKGRQAISRLAMGFFLAVPVFGILAALAAAIS